MAANGKEPTEVMEGEIIQEKAIVRSVLPSDDLALTPIFDLDKAKSRLEELQKFVKFYMKEEEDYGTIPGTPKPTLYKPGADKLCDIYALADRYRITNRTEDWDKNLFDYEVECTLVSRRTDRLVATGLGSCNSYEGKYRWRDQKRKCPSCGKETVIKGREDYGGGWLCWKKEGGCGSKWADGAPEIEAQPTGKVENEDIPTLKNTILKMAKKRAKIDAVLSATRSSGIFTQDVEDWHVEEGSKEAAQAVAARKIAEHTAKVEESVVAKQMAEVEHYKKHWEQPAGRSAPAKVPINLPPVNSPSVIEKVLKESIKKAEEKDAYAVSGMLLRAERKQGPKAKYMSVTVEQPGKKQVKLSLHPHTYQDEQKTELFNLMEMASGRFVSFLVKPETNPKFNPWVVRVLKIANLEFGQDGEPVRMKKEPEPLPAMQDEDLGEYTL